jgi:Ca2+-binding EF-hand superfamily protein
LGADAVDNLLCVAHGSANVFLAPSHLYAAAGMTGGASVSRHNPLAFPRSAVPDVRPRHVVSLDAGSCAYIPRGWLHYLHPENAGEVVLLDYYFGSTGSRRPDAAETGPTSFVAHDPESCLSPPLSGAWWPSLSALATQTPTLVDVWHMAGKSVATQFADALVAAALRCSADQGVGDLGKVGSWSDPAAEGSSPAERRLVEACYRRSLAGHLPAEEAESLPKGGVSFAQLAAHPTLALLLERDPAARRDDVINVVLEDLDVSKDRRVSLRELQFHSAFVSQTRSMSETINNIGQEDVEVIVDPETGERRVELKDKELAKHVKIAAKVTSQVDPDAPVDGECVADPEGEGEAECAAPDAAPADADPEPEPQADVDTDRAPPHKFASPQHLALAARSLRPTVEAMVDDGDVNEDGALDRREFVDFMSSRSGSFEDRAVRASLAHYFDAFDANSDGLVDAVELQASFAGYQAELEAAGKRSVIRRTSTAALADDASLTVEEREVLALAEENPDLLRVVMGSRGPNTIDETGLGQAVKSLDEKAKKQWEEKPRYVPRSERKEEL